MKKIFLKEIKKQLLQEKDRLEKELGQIAKKTKIKDDYQADYPELGTKEDENAQEVTLYENRLSLERNLENILKEVNKALKKIEQGKYGICEKCGKEIPGARLEALPASVLCLQCKKEGI